MKIETQGQPKKHEVYKTLIVHEAGKLLGASPIYVDGDMCDIIEEASKTWRPEALIPEDILVPQGFVYFARPFYISDRNGKEVNVRAFAYCPSHSLVDGTDSPNGGIALSFYSTTDDDSGRDDGIERIREQSALEVARFGITSELVLLHLAPVWFGMDPDGEEVDVDVPGARTGFEEWWTLFQVTFRMMMERISAPTQLIPDRHARKRQARAKFDPRNVIVVRLRRARPPRHADETLGESGREYSCRWTVVGHWRNQWYPSLGRHRQKYIGGYVKGPEGKPLLLKRRVYQWDR